jgi:hypothetical protein
MPPAAVRSPARGRLAVLTDRFGTSWKRQTESTV